MEEEKNTDVVEAEVLVGEGIVTIPVSHYEELVQSRVENNILRRLWFSDISQYSYDRTFELLFGKKPESEGSNAQ